MSSKHQPSSHVIHRWLLILVLFALGCGESGEDLLATAKAKAASISKAAGDAASEAAGQVAGDMKSLVAAEGVSKLTIDKSYELGCHIRFLPVDSDRGSMLQITSYSNQEKAEEYPAFLVHAHVDSKAFAELEGKSLPARFFFKSREKNVWYSPEGQDISLLVSKVGTINHELKIQASSILQANSGEMTELTAEFNGALE